MHIIRRKYYRAATYVTLILSAARLLYADTTFVAGGAVEGIWNLAGSPYVVQDSVGIADGTSLGIEAGVVVYFSGPGEFDVLGELIALGTVSDSIYFTTDTLLNPLRWRGLRFVNSDTSCVMEYCVIEHGRATGEGDNRYSGGVECQGSRPVFRHCSIRRNQSVVDAGGVYCRDNARPQFFDCEIVHNRASVGGGGIMIRGASPSLTRCLISNNRSEIDGGGVICRNGSVITFALCEFRNNSAAQNGGAVVCLHDQTALSITQSLFADNSAQAGGAIYIDDSAPVISRTRFTGNSAGTNGGAFYARQFAGSIANCQLDSNMAASSGGGIYAVESRSPRIEFCSIIAGGAASGGAFFSQQSSAIVRNSLVMGVESGAAIQVAGDSVLAIGNNCLFDNSAADFAGTLPANLGALDRTNLNGDSTDAYGNIFLDPLTAILPSGEVTLTNESPCISAAIPSGVSTDYFGSPRPNPALTQPDIGIHENSLGGLQYVCGELRGTVGPGAVIVGCDIFVETGQTATLIAGTTLLFDGPYKLTVRGTLNAIGALTDSIRLTRRFPQPESIWRGIRFENGGTGNLRYCAIEHAHGTGGNSQTGVGAVRCDNSSPHFSRCSFSHNVATFRGGAIACFNNAAPSFDSCAISQNACSAAVFGYGGAISSAGAGPIFRRCQIVSNSASWGGGGVHADSGSAQYIECEIAQNTAPRGGGMYVVGDEFRADGCVIRDNRADMLGVGAYVQSFAEFRECIFRNNSSQIASGGGVFCGLYSPLFDHCIFEDNSAASGAGLRVESSSPRLLHATLAGNNSAVGAGIHCVNASPDIRNSVFTFSFGSGILFEGTSAASTIRFCDFFGNSSGNFAFAGGDPSQGPVEIGILSRVNINADSSDRYFNLPLDPLFVDGPNGDYHISGDSPCLNAGDPTTLRDPDGTLPDIGTYFFSRPYSPPLPFDLISPANFDTIREESGTFCWHAAFDNDEADVLNYTLSLFDEFGNTYLAEPTSDSCMTVNFDSLGLPDSLFVVWYVSLHTNLPDTTTQSVSTWYFYLARHHVSADELLSGVPTEFSLDAVYPNPFNAITTIDFSLPRMSAVRMEVYDIGGRQAAILVDRRMEPGDHSVVFDAHGYPSGVYFLRMEAGDFSATRKLLLLK